MIIYCITNLINEKKYIGQTSRSKEKRWRDHLHAAKKKNVPGIIYDALRLYGKNNFSIEQIDSASSLEELNEKETWYIVNWNTLAPNGYNLNTGGNTREVSQETRQKMSDAAFRQVVSEETRKKLSLINKGRKHSEEVRKNMSRAHLGQVVSEETRKKISLGGRGRNVSIETCQKMSAAGKKLFCKRGHPFDEVNTYVSPTGARSCLTCYYICKGKPLPEKLKPYAAVIQEKCG